MSAHAFAIQYYELSLNLAQFEIFENFFDSKRQFCVRLKEIMMEKNKMFNQNYIALKFRWRLLSCCIKFALFISRFAFVYDILLIIFVFQKEISFANERRPRVQVVHSVYTFTLKLLSFEERRQTNKQQLAGSVNSANSSSHSYRCGEIDEKSVQSLLLMMAGRCR